MRVGVTGHREREGIDWSWVRDVVQTELTRIGDIDQALSSLATGSDQVFAEVAIHLGIPVQAVIPMKGYERYFEGNDLVNYRNLLDQCEVMQLNWCGDDERAFLEAGKTVVEKSDLMVAVWDGKRAEGRGGTGDVVSLAQASAKPVIHINPLTRTIGYI